MASVAVGLSVVFALTFVPERAHAQISPIETDHPTLQASLNRITQGSSLWRGAVDQLAATGRRTILVTPDRVRLADSDRDGQPDRFDATLLAEAVPIATEQSRVDAVVVIVNLALLEERYRKARLLPIEFEMDLDRILVHEIYGHAIPYLLAGDLSGRCADPQPQERVVDACSIQRENAVRAQLGLGRRVDYGLGGLNLSRHQ